MIIVVVCMQWQGYTFVCTQDDLFPTSPYIRQLMSVRVIIECVAHVCPCVTISKLGQKVTLQGIEPGSLM
jgi:hypothetical protein